MANYETLKAAIAAAIKENGNNEITGNLLQQQLLAIVNLLGVGYQFISVAIPTTNPGTPDYKCFYIASTPGTYTNFGAIVVDEGEVAVLKYDTAWSKEVTGAATSKSIGELGQNLGYYVGNPLQYEAFRDIDTGKWRTGVMNTSIIVPIAGASVIEWETESNTYYALLSDFSIPANGDAVSFATGYSDRVFDAGANHTLSTIPADAKYLYIFCGYINTTAYRPTSVKVDGIEMLNQSWVAESIFALKNSGQLSSLVADLPVSDGSDIQSGYAYIDSVTRNIKVKQ